MIDATLLDPKKWDSSSIEACLPGISNSKRAAVLRNERLRSKLAMLACSRRFGRCLTIEEELNSTDAAHIIEFWSDNLILEIGLAWFAPVLPRVLIDPLKRQSFSSVAKDVMRRALLAKDHVAPSVVGDLTELDDCRDAGVACVLAWAKNQEPTAEMLVRLCLPDRSDEVDAIASARVSLVQWTLDSSAFFSNEGALQ